jgi:hypothetical protein
MKIFLSYSHTDTDEVLAKKVMKGLEQAGLVVWMTSVKFCPETLAKKIAEGIGRIRRDMVVL